MSKLMENAVQVTTTRLDDVNERILAEAGRLSAITDKLTQKIDRFVGESTQGQAAGIAPNRAGLLGLIEDSLDILSHKVSVYNDQVERLNQERAL